MPRRVTNNYKQLKAPQAPDSVVNPTKRRGLITEGEYAERMREQGGVCAICGTPPGDISLAVDHCHESGIIRGLLCMDCNVGLGFFKDEIRRLAGAIVYLEERGYNPTHGPSWPDSVN